VTRETLDRRWVEVATSGGPVRIKVAERDGVVLNAVPEFEDCLRISDATGRPLKDVQAEAVASWRNRVS
jgi:pyridinium-3,5-bisthiocarboxylic acid mononucleotide nickel chelatase